MAEWLHAVREVQILKTLKEKDHIVHLIDAFESASEVILVLECAAAPLSLLLPPIPSTQ